jgi:NhaP-type Na+/H+ or K+/H+ antiporter
MKDKRIIILASLLAVLICLIITGLLFFVVTPGLLIILSFTIGVVTGVCIMALVLYMVKNIRNRRSENEN